MKTVRATVDGKQERQSKRKREGHEGNLRELQYKSKERSMNDEVKEKGEGYKGTVQ